MTDYMVEGLAKKRAEIAGKIENMHDDLRALSNALEHIDATLALVAPDLKLGAIKPKVFRPPAHWSKRGEMTRMVLTILRTARNPMTTREIGERMLVERGIPTSAEMLEMMTRRVACVLREQRRRGHASSQEGEAGFYQLWQLNR